MFNAYQFFEDLLIKIKKNENFGVINIHLNGGRKSGKTYSAIYFLVRAFFMQNSIDCFLFRWLKSDVDSLWNELLSHYHFFVKNDKRINFTRHKILNGTDKIQVFGIHSQSSRKKVELAGLERAKNKNYCIVFIEECVEFNKFEILDIKHAVGGYTNIIYIYASNPNSFLLDYIKNLNSIMAYNSQELQKKGYQFKRLGNDIYLYNNWRVNKYLSNADKQSILDTWKIDTERAKVVDWGFPGIENGLIYQQEISKLKIITEQQTPNVKDVCIGLDWGDGEKENSSATALEIVGITKNEGNVILGEYYWHNKNGYKTLFERAKEMLKYIKTFFDKPEYEYFKRNGVDFVMDRGLFSERDFLQLEAQKQGLIWLNFKFAIKNLERTRINIRKYLINTNRYFINEKCIEHIAELKAQQWDPEHLDKNRLPNQLDQWNHTTDAIDYAQSYRQYDVIYEDEYNLLYGKE